MREKPFDPSDTELLRALHSRNSKNIRNLQASLHRIYDLLTLVSSYVVNNKPPASAGGDFYIRMIFIR